MLARSGRTVYPLHMVDPEGNCPHRSGSSNWLKRSCQIESISRCGTTCVVHRSILLSYGIRCRAMQMTTGKRSDPVSASRMQWLDIATIATIVGSGK